MVILVGSVRLSEPICRLFNTVGGLLCANAFALPRSSIVSSSQINRQNDSYIVSSFITQSGNVTFYYW